MTKKEPKGTAAKERRFTSWGWTRYQDYEQCPAFAAWKHLDKLSEGPKSPAMQRGGEIGRAGELYIKGHGKAPPPEIDEAFVPAYKELRQAYEKGRGKTVFVEETWGFTREWEPCRWDDWDRCWVRVKYDASRLYDPASFGMFDFKTGKYREESNEDYMLQLDLYATGAFHRFPDVERVGAQLVYTDLGILFPAEGPRVYERDQAASMTAAWEARVTPMMNDRRFAPKPGWYCRRCPYSADRGGPCRF